MTQQPGGLGGRGSNGHGDLSAVRSPRRLADPAAEANRGVRQEARKHVLF